MIFNIETEGQTQFIVISDETIGDRAFMGQLLTDESEDIVVGRIERAGLGFRILLPLGAAQDEWRNDQTTRNIIESLSGQNDALESLRTRCAMAAAKFMHEAIIGAAEGVCGSNKEVLEQYRPLAERAAALTLDSIRKIPLEINHEETETSDAVGEGPSEQQGQDASRTLAFFDPGFAGGHRGHTNQQDDQNQGPGNSVAGKGGPETEG